MKFPLSWLREFVPLPSNVHVLADRLTHGGFEVEEILEENGETILEINVTPNRGDCLSILGLAREVGALTGKSVRQVSSQPPQTQPTGPLSIRILAPKACPRYLLAHLSGVKVIPSPDWLVRRLSACGIRSVNNVVDVTNYILLERGQPLHAFDASKIGGDRIVVRKAKQGEKILTLDGEEQELLSHDLVIADREVPIALAGIMGGKDSEIDGGTTRVALECAWFDPVTIRKTARRLGMSSESSYRFERGVDPEGMPSSLGRALEMIRQVAGGDKKVPVIRFGGPSGKRRTILFDPASVPSLLGGEWTETVIQKTFRRLSLGVRRKNRTQWKVEIPSHRGDLQRREDLIEEVSRLQGMERIPTTFPALQSLPEAEGPFYASRRRLRQLLASLGLQETIHLSFLSSDEAKAFGYLKNASDPDCLSLENPLGTDLAILRPSLLPSLVKTASAHHSHKVFDVRLFELRKSFSSTSESWKLAILLSGRRLWNHWSEGNRETDLYDLKGILERVGGEFRIPKFIFREGQCPYLHPSRQAEIALEDQVLGVLGEIHPDTRERFELKKNVQILEINWEQLAGRISLEKSYRDFSRTPEVERDLAILVDEGVRAGPIPDFIRRQDERVREVQLFDLYRGPQVPAGKKSLAFSIHFSRSDRTLTEEEVNEIFQKVVKGVQEHFGAEVR